MNSLKGFKLLDSLVKKGETVAVAVSGGVDSMVLLRQFELHAARLGARFFVINIEHGIRGGESLADSAFVEDYCQTRGIEFVCKTVNAPKYARESGHGLEDAARELRYAEFNKLLEQKKCDKIALAHHMDDQAETVLIRIIRGTGIRGLAAMRPQKGGYIRPLLSVTRAQIESYAGDEKVPHIYDSTNDDNGYLRNLIRNEIFPLLEDEGYAPRKSLVRLSRLAAEAEAFIAACESEVEITEDGAKCALLNGEHPVLFKRRAEKCMRAAGAPRDIGEVHLDELNAFRTAQNGSRLNMPYGITVYKEYDSLYFKKQVDNNAGNDNIVAKEALIAFSVPLKCRFGEKSLKIERYNGDIFSVADAFSLVFDASKIPADAVIRTRREGDIIRKFGGGTKSLGDFYTDKKVPARIRDTLPVIASGSRIYVAVGADISADAACDIQNLNSENIYRITLED